MKTEYKCEACGKLLPASSFQVSKNNRRFRNCNACMGKARSRSMKKHKRPKVDWEQQNMIAVELKKKGFTGDDVRKVAAYMDLMDAAQ